MHWSRCPWLCCLLCQFNKGSKSLLFEILPSWAFWYSRNLSPYFIFLHAVVWFLIFFQVALNILCVQTMSNPCSQCSRQFENDFILKLHIEFDHQAPKFWCDQCGKQFSTRWYNLGVYNRSYLYYIVKNIALEFFYSPNLAVMSIQLKYCCRYIYAKIYQISYQSHFHWIEVLLSFIVQKCMFYWKSVCILIKKWVYTSATGCTCNNEVLWVY